MTMSSSSCMQTLYLLLSTLSKDTNTFMNLLAMERPAFSKAIFKVDLFTSVALSVSLCGRA